MKKKLYIVTLEPLESRYTKQWYSYWKKEFSKEFDVEYIDGKDSNGKIEKGRFLDINKTNIWKAQQVESISNMFRQDYIKKGDIFIFADGWHFGITALKYMSQLNNIPIKIYGYWHSGTYDNFDFITQAGLREWASHNELGWMKACDGHFVATKYHKNIICKYFSKEKLDNKIHVVGFPMDWEKEQKKLKIVNTDTKKNIIVFPHRLDIEKQPGVFYSLKNSLPEYKFITTIDKNLSKEKYYRLLSTAKAVFSASEQETFGIGTVEAMLLGCVPIVPNQLAYKELYDDMFKYNDTKTARQRIVHVMERYYSNKNLSSALKKNQDKIIKDSLDAIPKMCEVIKNGI